MKVARELLFSVTKKDLKVETFKTGGSGGQGRDKRDTGVRITHPASGAVAVSSDSRQQSQNKKLAFRRLVETPKFKAWHRIETAHRLGHAVAAEESLDHSMRPENLKIEVKRNGRWVLA
jgi:peptide chain release factor 1